MPILVGNNKRNNQNFQRNCDNSGQSGLVTDETRALDLHQPKKRQDLAFNYQEDESDMGFGIDEDANKRHSDAATADSLFR